MGKSIETNKGRKKTSNTTKNHGTKRTMKTLTLTRRWKCETNNKRLNNNNGHKMLNPLVVLKYQSANNRCFQKYRPVPFRLVWFVHFIRFYDFLFHSRLVCLWNSLCFEYAAAQADKTGKKRGNFLVTCFAFRLLFIVIVLNLLSEWIFTYIYI